MYYPRIFLTIFAVVSFIQVTPVSASICSELIGDRAAAGLIEKVEGMLASDEFWSNLNLEKIVPSIDPVLRRTKMTANDIYEAFKGIDPAELPSLMIGLSHLFLLNEDVQKVLVDILPPQAREPVDTLLFRGIDEGPTRFRILRTFILNRFLALGSPEQAAARMLDRSYVFTNRDQNREEIKKWRRSRFWASIQNGPVKALLQRPLERVLLGWETSGKGDVIPTVMRRTAIHFFVNVLQYDHQPERKFLMFDDLPDIFHQTAVEGMNNAPNVLLSLMDVHTKEGKLAEARAQIPTYPKGKWNSYFIHSMMSEAFKLREKLEDFSGKKKSREDLTNEEWHVLLQKTQSPLDFYAYTHGIEQAQLARELSRKKEQKEIQRTVFVTPLSAYRRLLKVRADKDNPKANQEQVKQDEQDAVSQFAYAMIHGWVISSMVGVQLDPRCEDLFERDPDVQLAAIHIVTVAEKNMTLQALEAERNDFKNALQPPVRRALFGGVGDPARFPLGLRIVESQDAKSYRDASLKVIGSITKYGVALGSVYALYAGFNSWQRKTFQPLPIDKSIVWNLVRIPLNPDAPLSDPKYSDAKSDFLASAVAVGLTEDNERALATFARLVKPETIKDEEIRTNVTAFLNSPNFNYFHGMKSAMSKNMLGQYSLTEEERRQTFRQLGAFIDAWHLQVGDGRIRRRTDAIEHDRRIRETYGYTNAPVPKPAPAAATKP